MSLNLVMRFSYLLAWAFAIFAVVYRGLETMGVRAVDALPMSSRGVLLFSGFLFLATIATAAYAQTQQSSGTKARGTAA